MPCPNLEQASECTQIQECHQSMFSKLFPCIWHFSGGFTLPMLFLLLALMPPTWEGPPVSLDEIAVPRRWMKSWPQFVTTSLQLRPIWRTSRSFHRLLCCAYPSAPCMVCLPTFTIYQRNLPNIPYIERLVIQPKAALCLRPILKTTENEQIQPT